MRENKKKNKKTGSERRVEKCRACKDEAFKAGQPEFCRKCDEFFAKKESKFCTVTTSKLTGNLWLP